jgi:O-6-methylguanine DNA methyltransferase
MQKKILQYLQQIPPGKVVTYGQIAAHLGNPRLARAVGNALHRNPDGDRFPCYKVVSAQGKLSNSYAFGGLEAQKCRLQADGIVVTDDRLDLSKYQWNES